MNIDLLHYVENARKSGMADDKIREGLLQSGWQEGDINEALSQSQQPVAVPGQRPKVSIHRGKFLIISFMALALAVGIYLASAYVLSSSYDLPMWPFEATLEPIPTFTPRPTSSARACAQEAKLCPDGSAVGRTGPNCEFAPCPGEEPVPTGWKTYRNEEYGFEFKYPRDWVLKEGVSAEAPGFTVVKGESRLSILPKGEHDYGPPFEEPVISDVILASRKAKLTRWVNIGDKGELKLYRFIEIPKTWSSFHRLDFLAVNDIDLNILNQILSTFRFIEKTLVQPCGTVIKRPEDDSPWYIEGILTIRFKDSVDSVMVQGLVAPFGGTIWSGEEKRYQICFEGKSFDELTAIEDQLQWKDSRINYITHEGFGSLP